jgi:hypothetical protein
MTPTNKPATQPPAQHCFNCGEFLGYWKIIPGDLEICGKSECQREARYAYFSEREERKINAEEDDYQRY